jgi:hypothetical protein
MKFSATILALCLVQTTAFVAPQAPKASLLPLAASPNGEVSQRTGSIPESRTRALESRLMNLEQGQRPGGMVSGGSNANEARKIMERASPVTVQGGSLKTWSFASPSVERVQVVLNTEGRPLDADVELWQGPDNTPHKMRVYVEDGSLRPFSAVIETPRGPNTIAIRNTGQLEFPMSSYVVADAEDNVPLAATRASDMKASMTIQGGALRTYPFDPSVESVQVMLKTDGRPLNARIELLQGPNNNKQVVEVYTEDGMDRPFYAIIESPGSGNVVRVVNTATVEFPLTAWVEPFRIDNSKSAFEAVIGGDESGGFMVDRQWGR